MKLTRREILAMGAGGLATAGCNRLTALAPPKALAKTEIPKSGRAARLLNRAAFGPEPNQAAELERLGFEAWLDEQLHPGSLDDPVLMLSLSRFEALSTDAVELEDEQEPLVMRQLVGATLLRMTHSKWQLQERMTDFWSNHFNVYATKAHGAYKRPTEDRDVIRKHALGTFPDLLLASSRSPGMLVYLDNQVNRKGRANENYARELLELHTLGVHGGYSQNDVMEVARCFTGWTVENRFLRPKGRFRFDADLHDDGEKTVLGHRLPPGGGENDAEQVVRLLATHPSTARHIARKLCIHFLGTAETPWVNRLATIYLQSGGDIASLLRPLLLSPELLDGPPVPKRPIDFLVSACRATGAQIDGIGVQDALRKMGETPFNWPMPDGYPESAQSWSGSMLPRWQFAHALAQGQAPGVRLPPRPKRSKDTVERILHREPTASDSVIVRAEPPLDIALALASPEFQYK